MSVTSPVRLMTNNNNSWTAINVWKIKVCVGSLKYHGVTGAEVMSTDLKAGAQKVGSLEGSELTVTVAGGKVTVNDATVTAADVDASNGVIHVIDKVLLPR